MIEWFVICDERVALEKLSQTNHNITLQLNRKFILSDFWLLPAE